MLLTARVRMCVCVRAQVAMMTGIIYEKVICSMVCSSERFLMYVCMCACLGSGSVRNLLYSMAGCPKGCLCRARLSCVDVSWQWLGESEDKRLFIAHEPV